jgi:hypothetical protein
MVGDFSSLIRDINEFLCSCSLMYQSDRQSVITLAFSGTPLLQRIDFAGPNLTFVPKLVDCLIDYGHVSFGRHSLEVLLETVKSKVGLDRQITIDRLCDRIRAAGNLVPQTNDLNEVPGATGGSSQATNLGGTNVPGNAGVPTRPAQPELVQTGLTFSAILLHRRVLITSSEPYYLLSHTDVEYFYEQVIEQGRRRARPEN